MTSAQGFAYVIVISDYPACKNLQIAREYQHPTQTFGCCWNPMNANEFVTASEDGLVRLFDFSREENQPVKTFEGHTKKIYSVLYSPNLRNFIASCGDDRTIRIWRTDGDSNPVSICGGEGVSKSHT